MADRKLFHNFEFKTSLTEVGSMTTVLMDGVPLKGVISADVSYHYKDIPRVTLRLYADELKIESEEAEVEQKDG